MTYQRLPYDDAASTSEMAEDCAQVGRELHMPVQRYDVPDATSALTPAFGQTSAFGPSPVFSQRPYVSPELANLAAELELHFD